MQWKFWSELLQHTDRDRGCGAIAADIQHESLLHPGGGGRAQGTASANGNVTRPVGRRAKSADSPSFAGPDEGVFSILAGHVMWSLMRGPKCTGLEAGRICGPRSGRGFRRTAQQLWEYPESYPHPAGYPEHGHSFWEWPTGPWKIVRPCTRHFQLKLCWKVPGMWLR